MKHISQAHRCKSLIGMAGDGRMHMVSQVCDLQPGEFIHTIGDAHIYLNHVEALQEQLRRKPRAFPR